MVIVQISMQIVMVQSCTDRIQKRQIDGRLFSVMKRTMGSSGRRHTKRSNTTWNETTEDAEKLGSFKNLQTSIYRSLVHLPCPFNEVTAHYLNLSE
ncbi:Arginine biosynthesis bifunctional protein ArgJ [Dirofilaria immitis]